MNIKCTVTVIVICNVIIVRANINILNREIESRFSDNPKKKRKNIDETTSPNLTDLRHFSSQLVVVRNRIRSQRVSKLSYLGIIIRRSGGEGISSCWLVKVR